MAADERWYFTKEEINNSPSRRCGIDAEKELSYRQQGAKLIQDMGQRLQVTQLVINTAIVYMHRFYMYHPFAKFHRNNIAPAALFLAAKVEEQPRKLEHVIKVAYYILCNQEQTTLDIQSEAYLDRALELVMNENILLQTLGFDVAIDHPHTHVVKCFQMVRTTTELAQTSYFMATNSLHMTTMCLQYKPAVVACVCIYIVCKWSNYEIQRFNEGKDWFFHVDSTVTLEMLENLTTEFLAVLDKYPSRLKKLMNSGPHGGPASNNFGEERARNANALPMSIRPQSAGGSCSSSARVHDLGKSGVSKSLNQPALPPKTVLSHKEYSEKREKERREREKERERADIRDKHTLHPIIASSHHNPSNHPAHIAHPRPHTSEALLRKSHSGGRPSGIPSSAVRGAVAVPTFKEPNPKREMASNRSDEKIEKPERTSSVNNIDSAKFVTEKLKSNLEHRHSHSADWNQSRQLEFNKDRKEMKSEVKSDSKPIIKDKVLESKDHIKPEVFSKHYDNKTVFKSEPPVKVKPEKIEAKDEFKHQSVNEVKHNNSFIFNNNDFSLRDFLNPSEMPPEDIFDTEIDSKPHIFNSEYLPEETTHHKLNSPPKQVLTNTSNQPFHTPVLSSSTGLKGNNNNNSTSTYKQSTDSLHTVDTKVNNRQYNPNVSNATTHGNHSSEKNIGNGLPGTNNIMPSSLQTLQTPSSRRKEKVPSPHTPVSHTQTKIKQQNPAPLEVTNLPSSVKFEENKQSHTKDLSATLVQGMPKESLIIASQRVVSTTAPIIMIPEKGGNPPLSQQVSYTPTKSSLVEHVKMDSLNIRIPRPENCDVISTGSTSVSAILPANASITSISSPHKNYKREHSRHKHKEKKKHKHKEKDKHKDKESKEHKEHKAKKHKKNKDKDKEKEKEKEKKSDKHVSKEDASSKPLKITILRNKGIYTPDVSATNVGKIANVLPTPVQEKESASSSSILDTPARIKLTIPKSRLQVNATPGTPASPPRGIPPREILTTKVKLKIPKDMKSDKDRESRKRERERSPDNNHSAKIPRTSNYNAPQVLDSTRWSSQRH